MAIRHLKMVFPQHLMDEPVLFRMVKAFDVMPNIRRAKVSAEGGEIVLDLSGDEEQLDEALTSLLKQGVDITALEVADN